MLEVQRFLAKKSLGQLIKEFNIKTNRHYKHPNLVSLTYDQIKSPLHRSIVQECRGLVLDEADDWRIVSRGFNKFFNLEEAYAAELDFATTRFYEKLDGTFIVLYWYKDEWFVSTTGTPDAQGFNELWNGTLADLFFSTCHSLGYFPPNKEEALGKWCFFFELMTPYNQVVVRHDKSKVTCLGFRYLTPEGGYEYPPENLKDFFPDLNWPIVQSYQLDKDWDKIKRWVDRKEGDKFEGIVAVDHQFNRVKLKNLKYLYLHHSLTKFSFRHALEVLFAGEVDEICAYKPEFVELFKTLTTTYEQLKKSLVQTQEYCQKNFPTRDLAGRYFTSKESKRDPVKQFIKGFVFTTIYDKKLITPEEYILTRYAKSPTSVKRFFKLNPEFENLFNEIDSQRTIPNWQRSSL